MSMCPCSCKESCDRGDRGSDVCKNQPVRDSCISMAARKMLHGGGDEMPRSYRRRERDTGRPDQRLVGRRLLQSRGRLPVVVELGNDVSRRRRRGVNGSGSRIADLFRVAYAWKGKHKTPAQVSKGSCGTLNMEWRTRLYLPEKGRMCGSCGIKVLFSPLALFRSFRGFWMREGGWRGCSWA